MATNSSSNAAWAFNTMAPTKKGLTITNTTKNGVSMFAAPPPLVTSSLANPPPPTVAPPKRNNGFAFSMVGGCGPASHQPIPAFAPAPASLPPHPAHPPTYLPPSYTSSSFLPSTATAVPIPYTNNHSYTSSTSSSSSPAPASKPASFLPYNSLTSIPPSPFTASPLPPSLIPTTAQQLHSSSWTTVSIRFPPVRLGAPTPAEPPATRFVLDGLNKHTTEEMDLWTDEYSVYVNSLDEMDWDWTDDYLLDCCDVF